MQSPIKTLHIYCRVSSSKQLKGHSLEAQTKAGIKHAEAHGFAYELFVERGRSADNDNTLERPELTRLLEMCKQGKVTDIYVTELDRFARRVELILQVDKMFRDNEITIHAGNTSIDFNDPDTRFVAYLHALLGERENRLKTKRSTRAVYEGILKGRWSGAMVPYGYRRNSDRCIEPDPDEAEIYKLIVKMCLQGKGTNTIAKHLNELNVETRGKKVLLNGTTVVDKFTGASRKVKNEEFVWRPNTVCCILKNPIYKGERRYKGEIVSAPSIIDAETWGQVQSKLAKNKHYSSNVRKYHYMLRGMLTCGHCGRNLYGRIKPKDSEFLYICLSKREKSCGLRSPNLYRLEDLIWHLVVKSKEHLEYLQKKWNERDPLADGKRNADELKRLKRNLANYKDKEASSIELYELGRITLKVFDDRAAARNDEIKRLTDQIAKLEEQNVSFDLKQEVATNLLTTLDYIKDVLEDMSKDEKQEILNELIERIIVHWDATYKLHFIEVFFKVDSKHYSGAILSSIHGAGVKYEHIAINECSSPPPVTEQMMWRLLAAE